MNLYGLMRVQCIAACTHLTYVDEIDAETQELCILTFRR